MNIDLSNAMMTREKAAADLMEAAHALSQALAAFSAASDGVLAQIPPVAVGVGERATAHKAAQWAADPSDGPREDNQRAHAARAAGQGARAAVEFRMTQALTNNFRGGRPEEAIGVEFSTEAGQFLRPAIEIAATRAPQTQPDGQFLAIVSAQHQQLRVIEQQFT
jgi:hypothetical protein